MQVTPIAPSRPAGQRIFDRQTRQSKLKFIEVTWVETGQSERLSEAEFFQQFGRPEGLEILQGYAPHIVAVRV